MGIVNVEMDISSLFQEYVSLLLIAQQISIFKMVDASVMLDLKEFKEIVFKITHVQATKSTKMVDANADLDITKILKIFVNLFPIVELIKYGEEVLVSAGLD